VQRKVAAPFYKIEIQKMMERQLAKTGQQLGRNENQSRHPSKNGSQ
jgi:hypothetical protein